MEGDNDVWKAKIQGINPDDLLAIDFKYHLKCYVKNIVSAKVSIADELDDSFRALLDETEEVNYDEKTKNNLLVHCRKLLRNHRTNSKPISIVQVFPS